MTPLTCIVTIFLATNPNAACCATRAITRFLSVDQKQVGIFIHLVIGLGKGGFGRGGRRGARHMP